MGNRVLHGAGWQGDLGHSGADRLAGRSSPSLAANPRPAHLALRPGLPSSGGPLLESPCPPVLGFWHKLWASVSLTGLWKFCTFSQGSSDWEPMGHYDTLLAVGCAPLRVGIFSG